MTARSPRAILTLALLFAFVSCDGSIDRYPIVVAGEQLLVEVVDTDEARARGLMGRRELDERHGMLFVFPASEQREFWMKNTFIPLSIAYIDANWVIREIHDMTPHSLEPVASREPARYAIEVNQGAFDRMGVRAGHRIVLSDAIRSRLALSRPSLR